MSFRVDPATIDALAADLDTATRKLAEGKPAPEADAGPSSAAVTATVAELMRTAAGLVEVTSKAAGDLRANKMTYAGTDESNEGMFSQLGPR